MQGHSESVVVTIIDDQTLEGNHSFIAEIVDSDHIKAGQGAMIYITDNDCKYRLHILPANLLLVLHVSLLCVLNASDVNVTMAEDQYTVGEGDESVVVCVELSDIPEDGLELELIVDLIITPGMGAS